MGSRPTHLEIIGRYYGDNPEARRILLSHGESVAGKAIAIAGAHPELGLDREFLYEAAMLHDIGIIGTDAPGLGCHGTRPYICHGVIGAAMLRAEGLERHARVCERHTGAGLTREEIVAQGLPLPLADFLPETLEERVICYADNFFSKSRLGVERPLERVEASIARHGVRGLERFRRWVEAFGQGGPAAGGSTPGEHLGKP